MRELQHVATPGSKATIATGRCLTEPHASGLSIWLVDLAGRSGWRSANPSGRAYEKFLRCDPSMPARRSRAALSCGQTTAIGPPTQSDVGHQRAAWSFGKNFARESGASAQPRWLNGRYAHRVARAAGPVVAGIRSRGNPLHHLVDSRHTRGEGVSRPALPLHRIRQRTERRGDVHQRRQGRRLVRLAPGQSSFEFGGALLQCEVTHPGAGKMPQ